MKHLAAYMLLVLGGNANPSEKDIKKLMKDAGVAEDKESLSTMMELMADGDVVKMTKDGMKKFASMPSGGAGAPAAAAAAPAGGAAPAKEAKKEEPEEEEVDMDMGGLFGDDY